MPKTDTRWRGFEELEPRLVLATFTVDTTLDELDANQSSGDFSLREAIELANEQDGADTIRFSSALAGETITLSMGQLTLTDDVSIRGFDENGNGIDVLIDADGGSRHFRIEGATVTLDNLTLAGGSADLGGAIYNEGGTLTVRGSTISGGAATHGGAIYNDVEATLSIDDSTIRDNTASEAGGAIHSSGTLTVTQSTLAGNSCEFWGGAIYSDGVLTLTQSTFIDNEANQHGGAVYVDIGSTGLITLSTFTDNRAGDSGGAVGAATAVQIANSTVVGNIADADNDGFGNGGGVAALLGVVTLHSSIVALNTRGEGDNPSDLGTLQGAFAAASGHNLIGDQDSSAGITDGENGNIVGEDPELAELASNGGPTRTFAPLPGSPVIDAGSNPLNLQTDQRGASRLSGDAPDIGALESGGPQITSFEAGPLSIAQGDTLTLTASGADGSGDELASVSFYYDLDGDGVADAAELLGTDDTPADGFDLVLDEATTAGFILGQAEFLAVGEDESGAHSTPAQTSVGVIYSLRMPTSAAARVTSTTGEHEIVIRNAAGELIVFTGSGEDWDAVRLRGATGAPEATGEPVIWTDPKDGLAYIGAPSTDGFILYTRAADGTWSFRNLSEELAVVGESPERALTHFASTGATGRCVMVAGLNEDGELVGFQQTGNTSGDGWEWEFINISADLASQGMQTPQFEETVSYVTPWNAWTIAGIDDNGDIQGVWIAPASFSKWRVDNLSNITGAPPITGQLTVTQTSWSAINLGGVNPDGHLVVTWWIPRFGGDWVTSDLTQASGGEALTPGKVTGFVTPWGAINYAGLNDDGEVAAYWWTPQTNKWMVTALTQRLPDSEPRPVGTLTSYVSPDGAMSILGSAENGDVIRVWWMPGGDGFWHLTDISDEATRT